MRVKIYTDGACSGNPGPGGWAVVFNTEHECKQFAGGDASTTNNRMELTAVIECLKQIVKQPNSTDVFEVYSDSAYVVNAINNRWLDGWQRNGWKTKQKEEVKNKDLWQQAIKLLDKLKQANRRVVLIKIKGHAGNTFNELVDKLAKEQRDKAQSGK